VISPADNTPAPAEATFYAGDGNADAYKCTCCGWLELEGAPVGGSLAKPHLYCSNCGAQDTLVELEKVEA
jgi:hypothetical protein